MENKERLDIYLVKNGIFKTRQKAKYAIENGNILVNKKKILKSSKLVSKDDDIEIIGETLKYVSRGGLKLEKAINVFKIDLNNMVCMDIGASTGGFTDVMLKNGVQMVYAVDVGHAQLDKKILENDKVINMEGTNVKDLTNIKDLDFVCTDVSFISIIQIINKIYEFLKENGIAVILIKPQFEVGKLNLNKNGVVKDIKIHKKIVAQIIEKINKVGFKIKGFDYSPIKGPAGNIEYLLYIEKNVNNLVDKFELRTLIDGIIEKAFKELK